MFVAFFVVEAAPAMPCGVGLTAGFCGQKYFTTGRFVVRNILRTLGLCVRFVEACFMSGQNCGQHPVFVFWDRRYRLITQAIFEEVLEVAGATLS